MTKNEKEMIELAVRADYIGLKAKAGIAEAKVEAACESMNKVCEQIQKSAYGGAVVAIENVKQVAKYILHGVKPVDVYVDKKTEKIVFVFTKASTQKLYGQWLNHEL